MFILGDFRSLSPRHLSSQDDTLEWLARAHTQAAGLLAAQQGSPFEERSFLDSMRRRLARFGCSSDQITTRGYELHDCAHLSWSEMEVYRLAAHANGEGMRKRTQVYARIARDALAQLFVEVGAPPQHLIHVTCTGYDSPSAAQLMVTAKGWGRATRVTHAYHMGCYAALPALRIAAGFISLPPACSRTGDAQCRVDVVHTELCSLHMNSLRHEPEQLVVQSLFADGCISYSVCPEQSVERQGPGLMVLAMDEWLVPDSATSMAWFCSDFGFEMVLCRDVPDKLTQSLAEFVSRLLEQAKVPEAARETAVFAIHPGGPRIVDQIAAGLKLTEPQVELSRGVLRERGNMSSATLPHVWQQIVASRAVKNDHLVVSLAFGPGLTLSGAVMRKVGA